MTIWSKPHPWPEQYHWDNTRGIQFPRVDTGNVAKYIREIQLRENSWLKGFGPNTNLRKRPYILKSDRDLEKNMVIIMITTSVKIVVSQGIVSSFTKNLGVAIKNDCIMYNM